MPELPEVEVVRSGLADHVVGRRATEVRVLHPRAVRRHIEGDFADRLTGRVLSSARRRGKYLWLDLDDGDSGALLAHLGMSGQLLVQPGTAAFEKHLRVLVRFADGGPDLRFVDQRTFGGLAVTALTDSGLPQPIAHIAPDPMDPGFDLAATVVRVRRRASGVKRVLLDQTVVSGIGNIYADEALWRAGIHGDRPADSLSPARVASLLREATAVMADALRAGGTSFDALYVNVNGRSGYFERSLNVYGRAERPCPRCGTAIAREPFMNRSSHHCPRCQPPP